MSLNISNHMIENTHVHVCLNLIVTYVSYSVRNLIIWKKALVSNGRESSPVTVLEWPRGFQEVKVPRFHDNDTGRW